MPQQAMLIIEKELTESQKKTDYQIKALTKAINELNMIMEGTLKQSEA